MTARPSSSSDPPTAKSHKSAEDAKAKSDRMEDWDILDSEDYHNSRKEVPEKPVLRPNKSFSQLVNNAKKSVVKLFNGPEKDEPMPEIIFRPTLPADDDEVQEDAADTGSTSGSGNEEGKK